MPVRITIKKTHCLDKMQLWMLRYIKYSLNIKSLTMLTHITRKHISKTIITIAPTN